jgi:hypothetical protein
MKTLLMVSMLFITYVGLAQNFNGTYTSMATSYYDPDNKVNSFKENALFNISIVYENGKKPIGYILIQDPRIPKKVLKYEITNELVKITFPNETTVFYTFKKCLNVNRNTTNDIELYYDKQNKLNLMIYDGNTSQMFFDLKMD